MIRKIIRITTIQLVIMALLQSLKTELAMLHSSSPTEETKAKSTLWWESTIILWLSITHSPQHGAYLLCQ